MAEDQQSPQEQVEKLGIACTEDNLLRYVAIGDALVVDLLLKSGIRVSAKDAEGRSALFLASVNGQIDIARRLIEQGADPIDVVAAANNLDTKKKDIWDKLSALASLATILSSIVIAIVGGWFTYSYNKRQIEQTALQSNRDNALKDQQNRVLEMDTIQKMVPYLTKDEESKCVALLAITTLARPEVATQMATLYRGNGSVCALQKIAAAGDLQAKQQAVSALSSIATSSQGEDRNSALGALGGIFEKYKAGVVKVTASTDSGEMMSSGLVVTSSGLVLIPDYMAGASFGSSAMPKPHGFSVELWDGTKHQAVLVDVNESYRLAILKVDYPGLYPIVLSRKSPALSTTVIVVGFFQGTLLKAEIARVVSLDQHFVSVEPAGRYPGQETGGIGGGPILDDKGEAVGISHSSKSSLELFVRSDLAISYLHSRGYM